MTSQTTTLKVRSVATSEAAEGQWSGDRRGTAGKRQVFRVLTRVLQIETQSSDVTFQVALWDRITSSTALRVVRRGSLPQKQATMLGPGLDGDQPGKPARFPSLPGAAHTEAAAATSISTLSPGDHDQLHLSVTTKLKCATHGSADPWKQGTGATTGLSIVRFPASAECQQHSRCYIIVSGTSDWCILLLKINVQRNRKNFEIEAQTTTKMGKICKWIIHRKDGQLWDGKSCSPSFLIKGTHAKTTPPGHDRLGRPERTDDAV